MNPETVHIIEGLVNQLTAEFVIKDAIDNGDGTFTLVSDCTWWISLSDNVLIDGKNYTVEEFVINQYIKIRPIDGGLLPTVDSFDVITPNYIHGTVKMAANEIDAVNNKVDLVPFVYLFEVIREDENTDEESMIDRESDLRIFFLNTANYKDWLTEDHYTNVIYPMRQMVDLFIKKVKASKFFTYDTDYQKINYINFSQDGNQKESVFDCNLSGIELKLFAKIREDLSCVNFNKCNCN